MTELDSVEAYLAGKNRAQRSSFGGSSKSSRAVVRQRVSLRSSIVYWKAHDEVGPSTRGIPPVSEARS
jgi:hypothetical protein